MKSLLILLPFIISQSLKQASFFNQAVFNKDKPPNIRIELRMDPSEVKDSGKVSFTEIDFLLTPKTISTIRKTNNGSLVISEPVEASYWINFRDLLRINKKGFYRVEPGDEVVISSTTNGLQFSGKDADKYRLQYELDAVKQATPSATTKIGLAAYYYDSLAEYFSFMRHFRTKLELALPVLNRYKEKMADSTFAFIKDGFLADNISEIGSRLYSLKEYGLKGRKVSLDTLVQIFDTCHWNVVQSWFHHSSDKAKMSLTTRYFQIERAFGFDPTRIPPESEIYMMYVEDALKIYKDKELDRYLLRVIPDAMRIAGFTPKVEKLLTDYYASAASEEWKNWMKGQEKDLRRHKLRVKTPEFTLVNSKGKLFTDKQLKGKVAIMVFQDEKSAGEKGVSTVVEKAMKQYKDDPNVVFAIIATDKNATDWKKHTEASTYNRYWNVVNAHTGDPVATEKILNDFSVLSRPTVWVLDSAGGVSNSSPFIDLASDNGDLLAEFIQDKLDFYAATHQKKISFKKDGPYVLNEGSSIVSYSIDSVKVKKVVLDKNRTPQLSVQTDLDRTFQVSLQKSLEIQPSVYEAADKLIAFSDIEGNFDAFRKLLYKNGVIDENFNWVFGKGHLVFAGDMFDRGNQVTECLWLMYSLEEKAKAAGGYVHFVLGNHEIMNMQGYHHYVTTKYNENAARMGKTLTELYSEDSELGRWLRTKNVIEKIGDLLFVHGGISPEMNKLPLGIEDINRIVRPYYGKRQLDSTDKNLLTLYNSSNYGLSYRISPFWTRGYYKERTSKGIGKISDAVLDSSLAKYGVRRIITGHSIVADTISVHYDGRVINTDTPHAKGKTEALLIERDHYYRVDVKGRRRLLFIDQKRKGF